MGTGASLWNKLAAGNKELTKIEIAAQNLNPRNMEMYVRRFQEQYENDKEGNDEVAGKEVFNFPKILTTYYERYNLEKSRTEVGNKLATLDVAVETFVNYVTALMAKHQNTLHQDDSNAECATLVDVLDALSKFTNYSANLAEKLCAAKSGRIVEDLMKFLKDNRENSDSKEALHLSFRLLYNLSKPRANRRSMKRGVLSDISLFIHDKLVDKNRDLAIFTLINVVDEKNDDKVTAEVIKWLVEKIKSALYNQGYKTFRPPTNKFAKLLKIPVSDDTPSDLCDFEIEEFMKALMKLTSNDKNSRIALDYKVLDNLLLLMKSGNEHLQLLSTEAIWSLTFANKEKLNQNKALIKQLTKLANICVCNALTMEVQDDKNVTENTVMLKNAAKTVLWILKKDSKENKTSKSLSENPNTRTNSKSENDKSKVKEDKKSEEKDEYILFSYPWSSRSEIKPISDNLIQNGYVVWTDFEKPSGNCFDEDAINKAKEVIICLSETYKESGKCRTEANLAVELQKPVIPFLLDKEYQPDGWLGDLFKTETELCKNNKELLFQLKKYIKQESRETEKPSTKSESDQLEDKADGAKGLVDKKTAAFLKRLNDESPKFFYEFIAEHFTSPMDIIKEIENNAG